MLSRRFVAVLVLASLGLPNITARAAPDDEVVLDLESEGDDQFMVQDWNLEQFIFPGCQNIAAAYEQATVRAGLHLDAVDRVCSLSDDQRQKLELAARGDLRRLFDAVEELCTRFKKIKDDQNAFGTFWPEIQAMQTKAGHGLGGENSLLGKMVRATLTPDQLTAYETAQKERARRYYEAMIEAALVDLENVVPLTDEQHKAIAQRLLDDTLPPLVSSDNNGTYVLYRFSTSPVTPLKTLLNARQYEALANHLSNFRGTKMLLIQQGMISPLEADAPKKKKGRQTNAPAVSTPVTNIVPAAVAAPYEVAPPAELTPPAKDAAPAEVATPLTP
ncbi:MAG TPA: hypothetical protein VGN12_27220 [Pirellulales bacterium]